MSSDALVRACGFSPEAVEMLANAGCPMSSDALIRVRGSFRSLIHYRYNLIVKYDVINEIRMRALESCVELPNDTYWEISQYI